MTAGARIAQPPRWRALMTAPSSVTSSVATWVCRPTAGSNGCRSRWVPSEGRRVGQACQRPGPCRCGARQARRDGVPRNGSDHPPCGGTAQGGPDLPADRRDRVLHVDRRREDHHQRTHRWGPGPPSRHGHRRPARWLLGIEGHLGIGEVLAMVYSGSRSPRPSGTCGPRSDPRSRPRGPVARPRHQGPGAGGSHRFGGARTDLVRVRRPRQGAGRRGRGVHRARRPHRSSSRAPQGGEPTGVQHASDGGVAGAEPAAAPGVAARRPATSSSEV